MDIAEEYAELLRPEHLWCRGEVLSSPCPVPKKGGVYAWYFKRLPQFVPILGCFMNGESSLQYIGISPKEPPANGGRPSTQTLQSRIRYHYMGNAEGSTLRLTLGCLLQQELNIELRRVGSGNRMTFGGGEAILSEWMSENAFVAWLTCEKPWQIERQLISRLSLSLNLDGNRTHPFHDILSQIRREAKQRARELPVLSGG